MHETYMQRCLQLARMGMGYVAPNPMVGCVIVNGNKIIGEGYHRFYGGPHAEVNAIQSVSDKNLLASSTLYVNLEPCAHFGKTPPCTDLISHHRIPNVVIGCSDTYTEVAGKGIEKLKKAGALVTVGVLEDESRKLNKRFFTFHEKKRPYVVLKWAQSSNGFIDIKRTRNETGIFWITQPATNSMVHQWRHEEAGILVGWKTIATDNPQLTCRDFAGKNPTRVIIDRDLRLDYNAFNVGDRKAPTLILTQKNAIGDDALKFISPVDFSIESILKKLQEEGLQSLLVEGGKTTLQYFINAGLWDEARIVSGISTIEDGEKAPTLKGKPAESFTFGKDRIEILENV